MYVLVRTDLPPAQQAVQSCHASIEAARHFLEPDAHHPHLVVCGIRGEEALHQARDRLEALGVRCCAFVEPDRDHEVTALATEPLSGRRRRLLRRYKLLKPG
ncbi:MAG: peptidyl-tRNA hydrolase [Planctomycetota bacterium]